MGMIEGLDLPYDDRESVQAGPDASAQFASFVAQGRLLVTGFAYNSFLAALGTLLDVLANTTAALKEGGIGYVKATYEGADAAWRGKLVPVIGSFAAPKSASGPALIWWQAVAEMVIRLGHQKVSESATEGDQPGTHTMVELLGAPGAAAIPQRFVTTKTIVTLDDEIGRVLPPIYRGAYAYAQRLKAREEGRTADVAIITADETTNYALAQAVAAIYVSEQKKRRTIGIAAHAGLAVVGAGAAAVRKMKKR